MLEVRDVKNWTEQNYIKVMAAALRRGDGACRHMEYHSQISKESSLYTRTSSIYPYIAIYTVPHSPCSSAEYASALGINNQNIQNLIPASRHLKHSRRPTLPRITRRWARKFNRRAMSIRTQRQLSPFPITLISKLNRHRWRW